MALIQGIVDTQKQNLKSLGIVNSGDDLTIELEVKQNGVNIEFVNPIFELLATKSDGTRVRQLVDITYIGNVVNIIGDEQLVTSPGIVTLQLIIKDNKRSSTCLFYFMCGTSLDRDIIQSISKVEVLNQLDEYVVQAFANLKEYEQRIIASDASIRNLNEDMIKAEKVRVQAEINRGNTFDNLVLKMNNAINAAIATDETLQNNEIKRIDNYNTLKAELESIKDDLILLNNNISKEEEKRVQAEIDRVNKALEIIEKLKSTNDKVTIAEAERVTEFNNIKSELTSLKEALTTINNIANSNEEIRKTNESGRVAAEQQRVTDFEKIKSDNTSLGVALTKKVDDKIVEIEANNNTFKQGINEQYEHIVTENNNFKNQMNTDFGNAKTDYFGEEHNNVVDRLNSDFDNVHQRINDASYLEYEGISIKADNSYFGLTKDLKIKGRTLQNLAPVKYLYNNLPIKSEVSMYSTINQYDDINNRIKEFIPMIPLKTNTKYTIIANVTELTGISSIGSLIKYSDGSESYSQFSLTKIGVNVKAFTTGNLTVSSLSFYISQTVEQNIAKIKEVILLEGDYTNTPISEIPFGEGIYSVGESENNLINVKSCGKNLVELSRFKSNLSNDVKIEGNKITVSGKQNKNYSRVEYPFNVDIIRGKKITMSVDSVTNNINNSSGLQLEITKFNDTKIYISVVPNQIKITTLINEDIKSCNLAIYSNNTNTTELGETVIINPQIEISETKTEYLPYQESITEYQLIEPLRSLPNNIYDEIIIDELIRRVGKVVFDGNSPSDYVPEVNLDGKYLIIRYNPLGNITTPNLLCDKVPIFGRSIYNSDNEGVYIASGLKIKLLANKFESFDTTGVAKYFKSNQITVYYELAEPIITKLSKKAELKTYDGVTHFTSDNKLTPNLSVKIPSNVQAVLQDTRARNRELEIELETTTLKLKEADNILKEMDTDLIKTNWEMDDRLFEVEWALEDAGLVTTVSTFNINNKMRGSASVMALSKFEQAKIIIMSGDYDRVTLEGQLSKYLKRNIIAQEEYDTLISMMDAKEIVVGE